MQNIFEIFLIIKINFLKLIKKLSQQTAIKKVFFFKFMLFVYFVQRLKKQILF